MADLKQQMGRIMGEAMLRVMDNCLFGRHAFVPTAFGGGGMLCKFCNAVWQTTEERRDG